METVASSVNLKWVDATLMVGADSRGMTVAIGNKKDEHGEFHGLKASDLLLLAAASCSTYDVVSILKKQREKFTLVEVICTGEQESAPPYIFVSIHLHYMIRGRVEQEKVAKAIKLSEDKYCSVIATLRAGTRISSDYEIIEE